MWLLAKAPRRREGCAPARLYRLENALTLEREAKAGGFWNGDGVFSARYAAVFCGTSNVRLAAIESGCVQSLGFDFGGFSGSEVEGQVKVFVRIFVEDEDRGLPAVELDGVCGGVDAGGLNFFGEIGGQEGALRSRLRRI